MADEILKQAWKDFKLTYQAISTHTEISHSDENNFSDNIGISWTNSFDGFCQGL